MGGFTLELSQAEQGGTLGSALCRSRRDRGGFLVSNRTKRRLPRGFDRPCVTHWYSVFFCVGKELSGTHGCSGHWHVRCFKDEIDGFGVLADHNAAPWVVLAREVQVIGTNDRRHVF